MQDVLRHLHDHGLRSADPVQRRLLRPDRRAHPRRLAAQAAIPGRAVGPHPCAGPHVRYPGRPARARRRRNSSTPPASRRRRTCSIRAPTRRAKWFQLFQIGFGGIPGRPLGDGPDGHSLWPGFTNVPNEFLERYFPLRDRALRDGGGFRAARGCTAAATASTWCYRFLEPGVIAIHDDRWFVPPWGVNGGEPGARARKVLVKADGTADRGRQQAGGLSRSRQATSCTSSPGAAAAGAIRWSAIPHWWPRKCEQGLVTAKGALRYGVVLADGAVDDGATRALRSEMRKARGEVGVFNFGPDLATLRANCLAETGLPAPQAPSWAHA